MHCFHDLAPRRTTRPRALGTGSSDGGVLGAAHAGAVLALCKATAPGGGGPGAALETAPRTSGVLGTIAHDLRPEIIARKLGIWFSQRCTSMGNLKRGT